MGKDPRRIARRYYIVGDTQDPHEKIKSGDVQIDIYSKIREFKARCVECVGIKGKPRSKSGISLQHSEMRGRERLLSNQIRIKLPGNRYRLVEASNDENISSVKRKMASVLGVKERNWGIYTHQDNRLKIVDDTKRLNQVDRNGLHFYPKAIIR